MRQQLAASNEWFFLCDGVCYLQEKAHVFKENARMSESNPMKASAILKADIGA